MKTTTLIKTAEGAIRAQGLQAGALQGALHSLVSAKADTEIADLVAKFAAELKADKEACMASNKSLRESVKKVKAAEGLTGETLKAAVKAAFEAHEGRKLPSYICWDLCRKAVERAYARSTVKAVISTSGGITLSPMEKKKEEKKEEKKGILMDSQQRFDRIMADLSAIIEDGDLVVAKAIQTAINAAVNAASDKKKLAKAS